MTIYVVAAGEIRWWDSKEGYGLVVFDGGGQGFVASAGLKGTTRPRPGLRVEFVTARVAGASRAAMRGSWSRRMSRLAIWAANSSHDRSAVGKEQPEGLTRTTEPPARIGSLWTNELC